VRSMNSPGKSAATRAKSGTDSAYHAAHERRESSPGPSAEFARQNWDFAAMYQFQLCRARPAMAYRDKRAHAGKFCRSLHVKSSIRRGNPTVEAEVQTDTGLGRAARAERCIDGRARGNRAP